MDTWEFNQLVYAYKDCDGNDTEKQIKDTIEANGDTSTVSLTLNQNSGVTQLAFLGPENGWGYRSNGFSASYMV